MKSLLPVWIRAALRGWPSVWSVEGLSCMLASPCFVLFWAAVPRWQCIFLHSWRVRFHFHGKSEEAAASASHQQRARTKRLRSRERRGTRATSRGKSGGLQRRSGELGKRQRRSRQVRTGGDTDRAWRVRNSMRGLRRVHLTIRLGPPGQGYSPQALPSRSPR